MLLDGYSLIIDDKSMDPFVDASRMRPFRQRAEGQKMWEYFTDHINIVLDKSCFDALGINTTTFTTLYKKKAQVYQFNNLLLDGAVMEVQYDWDNEELVLGLHSYGRIIKNIQLGENYSNLGAASGGAQAQNLGTKGSTAEQIVSDIAKVCNQRLSDQNYDFRIKRTEVDTQDFNFYKSVTITEIKIPKLKVAREGTTDRVLGIYKDVWEHSQHFGKYYLVYQINREAYGVPITGNGVSGLEMSGYQYIGPVTDGELVTPHAIFARGEFSDQGYVENIISQLALSENTQVRGRCEIFEDALYYAYATEGDNRYFLRLTVDSTDKFIFKY